MYQLIHGDCLDVLPTLEAGSIDVVITDPPYGAGKAEWDGVFPIDWYPLAKQIAKMIVVITGSVGLRDSVALVGDDIVDVISGRNLNGMTRGPIGFGNWIAAVIACSKPSQGWNAFDFTVSGNMPNHPSPKPIDYMRKLIRRVTNPGDTILDPFMGSGSTIVAAIMEGRNAIGIEIDKGYYDIACRRCADAAAQPRLFDVEPEPKATQTALLEAL